MVKISETAVPENTQVIHIDNEKACKKQKIRSDFFNTADTGSNQNKLETTKVEKLSERERFFMNQNGSEDLEKTNTEDEIQDAILTMKENDKYRDAVNSKTSEDIATNNNESLAALNSSPCNGLPRKCSKELDTENMNNKQNLYKNSSNLREGVPSNAASVNTYGSYKYSSDKPIINGKLEVSLPQQPVLGSTEKTEETLDNERKGRELQNDNHPSPQNLQKETVNGRAGLNGCSESQPIAGDKEASQSINTRRMSGVSTGSSETKKSSSSIVKEAPIDAKAEACPEVPTKEKTSTNSNSGSSSSRVFRFVRMFNKKDVVDAGQEGGERASGRKHQKRVWGMCLQVQSPNADDEERMYSQQAVNQHGKEEKDSVKSEPLLDQSCNKRDSSNELAKTSSFNGIESLKNNVETVTDDSITEKKKSMKLPTDKKNKSFMRSTGGRRSFDKPERPSKLVKPRSSTLEDIINSNDMCARSSKTLPATPTSGTCTTSQDHTNSQSFYRRFYSHCMVLPMRKKKKEGSKKPLDGAVAITVIDKSPQRSAKLWDHDTSQVERTSDAKVSKPTTIEKEEEFEDSPKKLPVIDDLLAEIMESVTLMDIDLKENEDKLAEVPVVVPEDNVLHHLASTSKAKIKGWDSRDDPQILPSVPEPEDPPSIDLSEPVSKVGSLISKFEHGNY